jgi:PIN domain nuclease of toxin-antitoxin system
MKLLLDTHIFLWLNNDPEKLSALVLDSCENTGNEIYLSLVSLWEIQIKQQLGKLDCAPPLPVLVETQQRQNGLRLLPITLEHVYALANLPRHHNDPFDRLLIAQAIREGMNLVTADNTILQYPVATLS